ncbi:uncharacterized protein LOC118737831 [Rhagoletis pomonella]|uniref:uncharacterized protein LOC118737831 n=1 Tax=Rhagoletis pomonella TaxID=28610 RepID=UPI001785201B|nr:uncharacterized protein LOC118737831 [Rhagoletis pomonella]XP_036324506.1 uncharacterized protein LOC118737831 [Rhagoletis pomonella]
MHTYSKMHREISPYRRTSLPRHSSALAARMWLLLISIALLTAIDRSSAVTQLKLLINDDELLMQQPKPVPNEGLKSQFDHPAADDSGERLNLYRSELKRLSYETIHRILRDENEPIYRREDAEFRYYQKRSYQPTHEVVRRAAPIALAQSEVRQITPARKPTENTFKLTHAQLVSFDAAQDYEGNWSTIYTVDLSNNQLQAVNLCAFTALQQVKLANNSLTTIPLNGKGGATSTIITLDLSQNLIAQTPAIQSASLRELHLSGNQITQLAHLNLSMLSALETLDLSCNRIAELETAFFPQRMHNLKHLNLAYNRIGTIYRETFYNLLSLNTLLLSHNNIVDIDYETFLALPNLQYLDLSYNQLRGEAIRALQGIPDLVRLSIAYNPEVGAAMQEFVASWSLKELDASGTGLCQIPAALAQSVRTLKLTDNWLKIINSGDLDSYPLLQYLDLSHSRIEDIEDDALGRLEILETLFLDHNQLAKVPISLPTSLEHLFLQHNEIMDIQPQSFTGLNNLQTLDLSGNKLLYLPALPLPKLLTLNLRAAGLRGVSQAMVHTLPRLRDLLLDENPIKCSDLLSIAEWASPCRIVERSGSNNGDGGLNKTELESFNFEGNSIIDDLGKNEQQQQQQQQKGGHNRFGSGKSAGGQLIALSATADKLGQQRTDDVETLVDGEAAEQQLSSEEATKIELKQKFVRMHNFFEKFKSNCGAQKQTADGWQAENAHTPTPMCATEFEIGSGEPAECTEVVSAGSSVETSEATFNLPNGLQTQSEKSNAKMPTLPNLQQPDRNRENMTGTEAIDEDGGARRETQANGMQVEMKLFKFNQKNFTAEMAASPQAAATATTTITPTTPTKLAAEATFDYQANATQAHATTISRINEKVKSARPTGPAFAMAYALATQAPTQRRTTLAGLERPKTLATPTNASVVAKTLRQVAIVATGSGAATAANLLRQQITETTTVGTKFASAKFTGSAVAKSIAGATKEITTSKQATAPQSMLVSLSLQKQVDSATAAAIISSNNQEQQQEQTTQSHSINAKLAAKSSLNNTREISAYQQRAVGAQAMLPGIAATTTGGAANTTTNADAATSAAAAAAAATHASTAVTIQQLPHTISPLHTTDSNYYMTATTTTTASTMQSKISTKILPMAASFLQTKRAQAMPSAQMTARTTTATFNVEATMLTTLAQLSAGAEQAGQSGKGEDGSEVSKATAVIETTKVQTSTTTTTTRATDEKQTTQLSRTTIQPESMAKQKVDNNLTRNDSDNDGYKVQSDKQWQEEEDAKRVTATMAAKQLARAKAAQFWQQHNFKRANPYPNDISGQWRHSEEERRWQEAQDESTTEHTVATTRGPVTTTSPPSPHKHEPLQLHIRDRHLIGTPLLMHRGENMLVEAAEALRQTTVTAKTTTATHITTPTSTVQSSKATNDSVLQQRTMYDKALATSQLMEAEHQANVNLSREEETKANLLQLITRTANSNNFSNPERSQAEAINVETNVTPVQEIGSEDQQRPVKQYDRHADKQMLAEKVVAAKTTVMGAITTAATATTTDNINMEQHKVTASGAHKVYATERRVLPKKYDDIAGAGVGGRHNKPTLIMKKMTIQTKHAHHTQAPLQQHYSLNTPRENESVLRERSGEAVAGGVHGFVGKLMNAESDLFEDNSAHNWNSINEQTELPHNMPQHKHSTVNTPVIRDSRLGLLAAMQSVQFGEQAAAQEKLDAPTAQLSISMQSRTPTQSQLHEPMHGQERAAAHMQTQKWLDARKIGTGTAHPGVVILLSFSLLAVLLVGLMHVYRCDVLPWRRHLLAHQQRPHHQRQFNATADDDVHSFLHYHNNGGGEQQQQQQCTQQPPRWHHGTRSRAPYSSPLHNLHVRELQKTSAVELEAAARVTRSYYDVRPYAKSTTAPRRNDSTGSSASGGSGEASRNSSSSLSSTHSSSTAGILEAADDAFYVEMAAECGQMTGCSSVNDPQHCDMLPMELLAVTSAGKRNDGNDADAAVHETASLRLGGMDVEEKITGAVIGAKAGKQVTKARDNSGISALQANGCRSKVRSNTASYVAPSSSTRKFDLW